MDPNFFATFSLAAYPLVILGLFLAYRPPTATALSLLIAEMFLPPFYSLPLSSPTWLNKWTIPPLATLLVALMFGRSYMRRSRPLRGVEWFYVVMFFGTFMTVWTNRDSLQHGPTVIQGETIGDFISEVIRSVGVWGAFYLGRVMYKTERDLVGLCRVTALSGLVYTLPVLYEIRMSPQLQRIIYGFSAPHGFGQSVRWGGYRPSVFFGAGLTLTMFMLVCLILLVALARVKKRVGFFPTKALSIYFFAVLILCKSTGAIIYAALFVPLLVFVSARNLLRISAVLAVFFVAYPLLRFADVIPTKQIGDSFVALSPDRAQSLSFRFEMEQGMLDLTRDRPWFGWGGYGRNFVYDQTTGERITVPDGMVILTLSTRGLIGFAAYFGPFVVSVLSASRLVRKVRDRSNRILLTALTLACALMLFDLIINATLPPVFMLFLGALCGLPQGIIDEEAASAAAFNQAPEFAV
jgi:hypothetical protein